MEEYTPSHLLALKNKTWRSIHPVTCWHLSRKKAGQTPILDTAGVLIALSRWNLIQWVLYEVLQLRKIKQFVSGHGARKQYSHVATGESGVPSCEFLV